MKTTARQRIAAGLTAALIALVLPAPAHPQEQARDEAAINNRPGTGGEPTLDELLGLGEQDQGGPAGAADAAAHGRDHEDADADADPKLTRGLERRLSGDEAAEQFAQAVQEMGEVAIRLGDEADAGIDTQRMQDQIILKLEQIISSAQKSPSQQNQQQGNPKPGAARQADKPAQQQGQKPGQQAGQQTGQQLGGPQGDKPGQQQGRQANAQDGTSPSEGQARQGDVRNEELSMKDLREGEWGNLPPRLRDELAESLSETFNPVYRSATEAFYRRIAELSAQQAEGEE